MMEGRIAHDQFTVSICSLALMLKTEKRLRREQLFDDTRISHRYGRTPCRAKGLNDKWARVDNIPGEFFVLNIIKNKRTIEPI